jgi:hypothetical protein
MEYLCHDIKTERKDVSGGLPQGLKVVPVLFYVTLVACSSLYCYFEMSRNRAAHELLRWREAGTKFNQEVASIAQERKVIETANTWANGVAKWLEGAHNLQPLLVALGRGVGADATISEVLMSRNSEIASQIQFTLKMNSATSQVLDRTLEGIRKLDFRAYSAQQQKEGESLDYNAILVFQPSEESGPRVAKTK